MPISHPSIERLIGTIRREYLDHVPFWNSRDLERKLSCFQDYYNRERPHRGIGGAIADPKLDAVARNTASFDNYLWKSCCRGLYQLPIAA
ncbi:MAG: transposase [Proteobacteria bacterium]|nr:transposase [Pseudomonadota bacterium]